MPPRAHRAPRRAPAISRELIALAGILALAAVARIAWLPTRGQFDADQGHDMLVLRELVLRGVVPLLGPPASVGAGHHGALSYLLLAPAAWLNGASDPVPVVALIALGGVLTVGAAWWLARSLGGPPAGVVAALLVAVSASATWSSTFLWNPNLVPLASGIAFAAAAHAWREGRARWWVISALGASVAVQLHALGILVLPPLALLVLLRRRADRPGAGPTPMLALACAVIVAAGFVPLVIHEAATGFGEARAIAGYLTGGLSAGGGLALGDLAARVLVALVRVAGWPIAGSMAAAGPAVVLGACLLWAGALVALRRAAGDRRLLIGWIAATVAYGAVVLGALVPGSVVLGPLPTDQYHAWSDPLVAALAGVAIATLAGAGAQAAAPTSAGSLARVPVAPLAAAGLAAGAVAWNLATLPPPVSPAGDWASVRSTADRLLELSSGESLAFISLPGAKSADAYAYPLAVSGATLAASPSEAGTVVVLCEAAWVPDCGGAAEDRAVEGLGGGRALVERMTPVPGRTISVYRRGEPGALRGTPGPSGRRPTARQA